MIEETTLIYAEDFKSLLDLENSYKLYKLSNIKKLDFGYICYLTIFRLKVECICKPRKDGLDIIEKNGRFIINITFQKESEERINVKISYRGILEKLLSSIVNSIRKNLEEYSKYLIGKQKVENNLRISTLKPDKVVDLRGEECPVPEITLKRELMKANRGEIIEALTDNPAAVAHTIPEIIKLFNCRYEVLKYEDYVSFRILVLSNTINTDEYVKVIKEFNEARIRELIRDKKFMSFLYTYFVKFHKVEKVNDFKNYRFNCEKDICLVSSAPLGRGWLFTGLIKSNKMVCARIDTENETLLDYQALEYLKKLAGETNVMYLSLD